MKISLRWVFDHIKSDWKKVDVDQLVDKFNKSTAEIEGFHKVSFDFNLFSLCEVKSIDEHSVKVFSSEWNKELDLSVRDNVVLGDFYLVKKDGGSYLWAQLIDFDCQKDGFVPALYCEQDLISGGWKSQVGHEDYIFEIDNKSITHRPDMWGHRGFSREIAAILDLPFESEDKFLVKREVKEYVNEGSPENKDLFSIKVEDSRIGKRFAGLYFSKIKNRPSSLWMALRLMSVGSRPIDAVVDFTNYVMLDISQPMHAFDSDKLSSKTIIPRLAKNGEKLTLLDGDEIELTESDYVVTDGNRPIALAGVMGGRDSGIEKKTKSIFLESANFDYSSIRMTALRFHKRTEASARFEKSLDPNQNVSGIFRFLKILDDEKIEYDLPDKVISLGKRAEAQEIIISKKFIERRLGADLDNAFIKKTLEKIEFKVKSSKQDDDLEYQILVPTFRGTKDVNIPVDIVEEVGRFFGYENINYILPKKATQPYDLAPILKVRKIKKHLAYSLKMHEVCNYPFYDESFLNKLHWEPKNYAEVKSPVSENWKRLVTSLIPHLIKNIDQNIFKYNELRFFEWARIWNAEEKVTEKKVLSGIFFDAQQNIDFYDAKSLLSSLFDLLNMNVTWKKVEGDEKAPWFFPYQSANIVCSDNLVGTMGKLDPTFFDSVIEGDAFAFELDSDFLLNYRGEPKKFSLPSKYPEVVRDVSIFIHLSVTVEEITKIIQSCNDKIVEVYLIDFFQKDDWRDKKSLTFRFILQDYTRTLEKEDVDSVYDQVTSALKNIGATLR